MNYSYPVKTEEIEMQFFVEKNGKIICYMDKDFCTVHCDDGPAIVNTKTGRKEWFNVGVRHREDGPAVEDDKHTEWFVNGCYHRENGPAIEYTDGTKIWYKKGLIHREDGPAHIRYDGILEWFINGKLHREDGPAHVNPNNGTKKYYIRGNELLEVDFLARNKSEAKKKAQKSLLNKETLFTVAKIKNFDAEIGYNAYFTDVTGSTDNYYSNSNIFR